MTTTDLRSNLEDFYYENILRAQEAIREKYECFDCDSYPEKILDTSEELIRMGIKVDIDEESVEIIVGFPSTFPDALPKLYLSKNDFNQYYPLPHLQSNGFICTRDPNVVDINERKIEEATLELIDIAIEDLKKNIGRRFNEEFKEEFLAYWEDRAKYRALFLSQVNDEVKLLRSYSLSKKIYGTKTLITDNEEIIKPWVGKLGVEYKYQQEVLFIPLRDIDLLPKTNFDIFKVFSKLDAEIKSAVENFYNREQSYTTVVFSLNYGGVLLAGFVHKKWDKKVSEGFRNNSVPWKLRLLRSRNVEIEKIKIINIDDNRLLNRGGYNKLDERLRDAELKIIGCGSVGSKLSMSLAQGGINKFSLIDPDNLKPENIHRHLCGFSFLMGKNSIPKVEAVKNHIQNHLPHISISTYDKDILKMLMENDNVFVEDDCIILATADRSVERRLNSIIQHFNLKVDLIILWLEPYGIGGHLVYINPNDEGCYQCCYNESDHFIYSFSKSGQRFNKREAGCQSSFIPYSNVELEQFVSLSAGVILDILSDKVENSRIYSWFLNSRAFEVEGYSLSDYWLTAKQLSLENTPLRPNPMCLICKDE